MWFLKVHLAVYQERGESPEIMNETTTDDNDEGLDVYELVACVYLISVGVTGLALNIIALIKVIKVWEITRKALRLFITLK